MHTIQQALHWSDLFCLEKLGARQRGLSEPLLAHLLHLKRMDLYLHQSKKVSSELFLEFQLFLQRAVRGEPIEYILRQSAFLGCSLWVDQNVLIPRQETEILAASVVHYLQNRSAKESLRVLDLCTGSGCLAIAFKKTFPEIQVSASDLSRAALEVAQKNAKHNQVEIDFRQGDLLAPFSGERVHLIVCNPPYISEKEYLELDPSVAHFEPRIALVGGRKGVEFYERLEQMLPDYLEPEGVVFFEIGASQGGEVQKIFSSPRWRHQSLKKDWSGHPRFFSLEKDPFFQYDSFVH